MFNLKTLLSQQFPSRCELCGLYSPAIIGLCHDCISDLPALERSCQICAIPMPTNGICGNCICNVYVINKIRSPYLYAYPLDKLIKKYKYKQKLGLVLPLTQALSRRVLARSEPLPEVIVPVPLHFKRVYTRGFNQALIIARIIAGLVKLPVDFTIIERARQTIPLFDMTPSQRVKSLDNAFRLTRNCNYQSVAIVDDIITTGATGNEIARLFRRSGVKYVEMWSLARAEL